MAERRLPGREDRGVTDLPVLRGGRVILRLPSPEDLAARLEVPIDPDPEAYRMYGGSGNPKPSTAASIQSLLDEFSQQDYSRTRNFLIAARVWPDGRAIDVPIGRYIGIIRLPILSWEDRRASVNMGIYDRRFWSHGYGSEALRLLLGYAFDEAGLHRVGLRVIEYNTRAIRCYEKCGFVREGVERQSALVDGAWYDDIMMSILEPEYRARFRR